MKKLIAIFILCFLTGVATVNAAYQRHQKQPNFFMPKNAVKNTVDKPNFTPRQIPSIPPQTVKKQAATPTKNTKNTAQTTEPEKTQAPTTETKVQEQEVITSNQPALPQKDSAESQTTNAEQISQPQNIKPTPEVAEKTLISETEPADEYEYVQSFREYAEDLQKIARSEPVYNSRLTNNLAKYKDQKQEEIISVK